jgi:hypothetical protein
MFKVGDYVIAKKHVMYNYTNRDAGPLLVVGVSHFCSIFEDDLTVKHPKIGIVTVDSNKFELAKFIELPIYKALTEVE